MEDMEEGQEEQSSENEEIFLEEGGEILDITPEEMEEVLSGTTIMHQISIIKPDVINI